MTKEEIKKNNELFANALTLKLIWKSKTIYLLSSWGFGKNYIDNYITILENFILSYKKKLENTLLNIKK